STVDTVNIGDAAIYAWRDHGNGVNTPDNTVEIVEVDVIDDGRLLVGSKVRNIGGGMLRYEYAIYNLNSNRSVGGFVVPRSPQSQISNVGFSDVDYHSGEIYDNTDWVVEVGATTIAWHSPESWGENPDGNAIRWGTMYNFWFDSDTGPGDFAGGAPLSIIEMFIPGDPAAVDVSVPAPVGGDGGAIPTVSEWGMIALTALLMGGGWAMISRRRVADARAMA
ncbi:MAG: IPTL-CTERM sorting domain-containing protein, partial [Planctomycetes bacterium]|nr:IPTL-CTERM sorting domain-containing protein [Planctomycetota bacterium]